MYEIIKSTDTYGAKLVLGREYYAQDGGGMYVPVLFVPYFEWDKADKWVPNWSKDQEGNRIRNGDRYITKGDVLIKGIKQVWKDRRRLFCR
jgi:uncharacterized Zn ribbon protein